MSALCAELHQLVSGLPLHSFPFEESVLPENGIYILFEKGEFAHGVKRIVRVGTHTGDRQLRPRLRQHFIQENKDRSIFRKNIGRALLYRLSDPFLKDWNLDLTTAEARRIHGRRMDYAKMRSVEAMVTQHLQSRCAFCVIPVPVKSDRLLWESRMVSTVASCTQCNPSDCWLGLSSPLPKIRESGLWQVNELFKASFSLEEFAALKRAILHF